MEQFWNFIWLFFWSFAFIAYLFALFAVISDIFRDHELSGWLKAVWIIFLVFVPFLTVLVYLIARGRSMAERQARSAQRAGTPAGAGRRAHRRSRPPLHRKRAGARRAVPDPPARRPRGAFPVVFIAAAGSLPYGQVADFMDFCLAGGAGELALVFQELAGPAA